MSDDLATWLSEIERRMATMLFEGKVTEVHASEPKAKVRFAFGQDNATTPWLPYGGGNAAGEMKEHVPLTVGEWVTVTCPGGDLASGRIIGRGWTNDNPPNHTGGDAYKRSFGNAQVVHMKDKINVVVGSTTFEVKADGVFINGARVQTA